MEKLLTKMPPYGLCFYAYTLKGEEEVKIDTDCPRKARILRCLKRVPKWITSALEEGKWVKLTDAQYDPTTRFIKLIGKVITPTIVCHDEKWKYYSSDETGYLTAKDGEYILVSVEYKVGDGREEKTDRPAVFKGKVEVPCPGTPYDIGFYSDRRRFLYRNFKIQEVPHKTEYSWEGGLSTGDEGNVTIVTIPTIIVTGEMMEDCPLDAYYWSCPEWVPIKDIPERREWSEVKKEFKKNSILDDFLSEDLKEQIRSLWTPEKKIVRGKIIDSRHYAPIKRSSSSGIYSNDGMREERHLYSVSTSILKVELENGETVTINHTTEKCGW